MSGLGARRVRTRCPQYPPVTHRSIAETQRSRRSRVTVQMRPDRVAVAREERHLIEVWALIEFRGVTKRFDDGTVAVNQLDLLVAEGQITVLVGPSGCGKTTSLRMVNRMVEL
ncbi:MAG: ATP-binding cassette domain-containing protein, partial [Pseudonocardiaceae bacterium]